MADPYLTPDDIRDWYPAIAADAEITDAKLSALIAEFESIAERYTGVAYVPRETTETVEVCGRVFIASQFKITSVDSIEIEGVAVTGYTFTTGYSIDFGTHRTGSLVVTYTHGFTTTPPEILRACREYVRACALADRSRIPRDVISQSGDGFTTRYSTPDWNARRPTGFIEVDRILNSVDQYRTPRVA